MILIFELSGEHETLPKSEVLACMRALGIEHRVAKSGEQCLMLDTNNSTGVSRILATRLAMTHRIVSGIFECDISESDILKSARDAEIRVPPGETFSVRVKQIQRSHLSSTDLEKRIGEVIFEHNPGSRVDLKDPDHSFRLIITNRSCIFGEVLASVDRKQFWERKPHKKPFFYPGTILPEVSRALVNLCEIRSNDLVLDPFCGTGGILVEASMIGARVIGIDVQESMLPGAEMNLEDCDSEYHVLCGDACNLPIADQSVDAVVTDPPYGRSAVVMAESVESLYRGALLEIYRVLKRGGHAVVISDFELSGADDAGFVVAGRHSQRVHRSLTRYAVVLRK
ncbi:MAG: methyltransferase domain-containing protein [Euryarchaeota archaeon]|nr:methyltransferase domain-containing protein [Euryarchaeota archaeon]